MNAYLTVAAALNAIAALLHVGCIVFGAPWYRFFGAGERMARLAEQGSATPTLITAFIVLLLSACSAYALSAAGIILKLPFLRLALIAITAIYFLRGIAGLALMLYPNENSPQFWLWSSVICLVYGMFHLLGLAQRWAEL